MIAQSLIVNLVVKTPIYKLLQIQTSYQSTFLMLVIQEQGGLESMLHVDTQGNIISRYSFDSFVEGFVMITPREAAVALIQRNELVIIDIIHREKFSIKHEYLTEAIDGIELYSFHESSMFCVRQYNMYTRRQLRLTYYSQSHKNVQLVFSQQQKQLENIMFISKLNNYSQIGWYIRKYHQFCEEVIIHDITTQNNMNKESQVQRIRLQEFTFVGLQYDLLLNVAKVWQIRKEHYLLMLTPSEKEEKHNQTIDFLILEKQAKIIRIPQFVLPTNSFQSAININFLQQFSFIQATKIQYLKQNQKVNNYFICHRTEELFMHNQADLNEGTYFMVPSFDKDRILKVTLSNTLNTIELQITTVHRVSQIFLHLLLEINQHFDDDLLQDAIQLLTQS